MYRVPEESIEENIQSNSQISLGTKAHLTTHRKSIGFERKVLEVSDLALVPMYGDPGRPRLALPIEQEVNRKLLA
jgi:hypothetical protein